MYARPIILAGIPAAVLVFQSLGSAQESAVTAVTASTSAPPAAIKPVLDAPHRSIRLEPLGASVAIPDAVAIQSFNAYDNFMGISGDFGSTTSAPSTSLSSRAPPPLTTARGGTRAVRA